MRYWPEHLDTVLAKSADRGGETLAQHTWDVLEKLAASYQLRPDLSTVVSGQDRLWHCLFWGCLLHDFGKAAHGFQAMLAGGPRWLQRHEILSLAFVDWIAPKLTEEEQTLVVAAIASHHRDASVITSLYPRIQPDPLLPLFTGLDQMVVSGLWHWIDRGARSWIDTLGLSRAGIQPLPLLDHDSAICLVMEQGVQRVRFWLRRYERWVDDIRQRPCAPTQLVPLILLRGLTTTADHMASAHLKAIPAPLQEDWRHLMARVLAPGQQCYLHQELSAANTGRSALLVAPTGSGKTESGLYWALGNGSTPVTRLFYVLPYQASMNAMWKRLQDQEKGFAASSIGLQHGRAVQALYSRLVSQEEQPATAARQAAWEKNINTLHARPVKVVSPYQMLKAVFQLRGFEGMLTDYVQAAFIFDEIHAYEPARLALILSMVAYLRKHYGARFFVMSATLPTLLRARLQQALDIPPDAIIEADASVYQRFRRHHLHLLSGELLNEGIAPIIADVQAGKAVLVCANSVRRAQALYQILQDAQVPASQLLLIHSRYILKHRIAREEEILRRCAVGVPSQPLVLIATQVVEVSLNIDLDTIYSDPAPLEALLQRFGRVNRACQKEVCPVHVFRSPCHGQYIYHDALVQATLKELECHHEDDIDESQITDWLNRVYDHPAVSEQWEREYQQMAQSAQVLMANIRPFESDTQSELFEEMFDNVDVVPECFSQQYRELLKNDAFLEASQYLVSISKKKYQQLERRRLIISLHDPAIGQRTPVVRLPYHDETGLSFEPTTPSSARPDDKDWD